MKKLFFHIFTISMAIVFLILPAISSAQEATQLDVDVSAICESVNSLEPIGASVSFPVSVGELSCFTRIIGAHEPTTVTHVWYFGMTERARVELVVKGSRWRTYSSKKIQPNEVGSWRVEVMDTEGTVLKVIQFITTSGQETVATQPAEPVEESVAESVEETETPDQSAPIEEPSPPALAEEPPEQPAE